MGLGPSHIPQCRHCEFSGNVTYVFILSNCSFELNARPGELMPWFNHLTREEMTFYACDKCIDQVPSNYQSLFIYRKDYRVNGM
jgi:hypothetical protein